jgi:PD-(D/E)XK endonuclease
MDEHPKAKGDKSTLAVMLALHELGFPFLVPLGENTRYDLALELGSQLARCKTGRLRDGAVLFKTCSTYDHHPYSKPSRDYSGQIDYFAVYCPQTSGVYLIPIADLPNRVSATLRIDPPRNNQRRLIRLAADYEIAKVSVVAA